MPVDTLRAYARWSRAEFSRFARRSHARSPRTALLIAPSFPPPVNGGSYRPLALAQHGPRLGWKLVVIGSSTWESSTDSSDHLLAAVPPEVIVDRVPLVTRYSHARLLPRVDGGFSDALATIDTARRATGSTDPTVVVASGPPFDTFIAGYYLAKAYGCHLVLDYRDEWTECPFEFVDASGFSRAWEQRCLRAADLAVFVTDAQREHHLRAFPWFARAQSVVIRNGWEPVEESEEEPRVPIPMNAPGARVTISFVGGFFSFAAPAVLFSALERVLERRPDLLRGLRLRFVGKNDAETMAMLRQFRFQEALEVIEHVPVPDAFSLMRSSAALLLLNPPELGRSLPGKLYNYIASGRPVLVFGEGGEAGALVCELDAGLVIPADDEALERALDDIVKGTFGRPRSDRIDEWLLAHTRTAMAERYFQELAEITVDRKL